MSTSPNLTLENPELRVLPLTERRKALFAQMESNLASITESIYLSDKIKCDVDVKWNATDCKYAVLLNRKKKHIYYFILYNKDTYLDTGAAALFHFPEDDCCLYFTSWYYYKINKGSVIYLWGNGKKLFENFMKKNHIKLPWISKSKKKKRKNKYCNHCKAKNTKYNKLKLCSLCQRVYYCSRHCQKISWKYTHRHNCIIP